MTDYKASKRIVGTSAEKPTTKPQFSDTFPSGSESSGWTIANGTNTTFGSGKMTNKNVRTTTNESVAKSLGLTTTSTAWVLRFKVKRTGSSGSQGRAFVEISNQDQGTSSGSSSLSSVRIQLHDTNAVFVEQVYNSSGSGSNGTSTLSADTDYWIEVKYTGTGATAQVFTDSSYSTPLSGTSTATNSGTWTPRTYQYFAVRNPDWSSDGDWKQYEFDDIKLCDGTTTFATTTVNVQTNSIYEDTTNGKHYIWSGSAWVEVA